MLVVQDHHTDIPLQKNRHTPRHHPRRCLLDAADIPSHCLIPSYILHLVERMAAEHHLAERVLENQSPEAEERMGLVVVVVVVVVVHRSMMHHFQEMSCLHHHQEHCYHWVLLLLRVVQLR